MLILKCILGLQSQSIDFTDAFAQADIPSGEKILIELPWDFKSDGGQHDVVLKWKKSLYGQAEAACLWYEKYLSQKSSKVPKPCGGHSQEFGE